MPNSNAIENIIKERWSYFSTLVFQDIKELYLEKNKIELEIKKIEKEIKIIKYSQNDLEILLTHKDKFIEIDNELVQPFAIIEAFKKRNALDNGALKVYHLQILNSPKIQELSNKLNDLNQKKLMLESKIDELEDLRSERKFSDELIKEISRKYNLDSIFEKYLRLYPVLKSKKHKTEVTNISTVQQETNGVTVESVEEQDLNKVSTELILNEIEVIEETKEDNLEDNQENNLEYYNDILKLYEELFKNNKVLIDKYYSVILNMKEHEILYYSHYVDLEELNKKELNEDNKKTIAKTYAIKLFKLKEEINENILLIKNDNYQEKEYIQYLEEIVKDFNESLNKLKSIDELIEKEKEIGLNDVSNVYFLLDKTGELIIPEDEENYIQIYSKLSEFTEVDNLIKKDPFSIKEATEELGRATVAQRMNNSAFAYVKVKTGQGTTGTGILVIGLSTITKGAFNKIKNSTNKLVTRQKDLIQQQIKLIEERNLDYLQKQLYAKQNIQDKSRKGDKNARKHG